MWGTRGTRDSHNGEKRRQGCAPCEQHRGPQQNRADPVLVRMSYDNKQVGGVKTDPGSCPKQVVAVLGSEAGFPRAEGHRWGPQGPSAETDERKPQSCLQEGRNT